MGIRRLGIDIPSPTAGSANSVPAETVKQEANTAPYTPRDLYQSVTDKIVAGIEDKAVPWLAAKGIPTAWPCNGISGNTYHGINVPNLMAEMQEDPRWCTFKQAKEKGWYVRKGEKGTDLFFWKLHEKTVPGEVDEKGDPVVAHFPILKTAKVFNFAQIEGAPPLETADIAFMAHDFSDYAREQIDEIIENSGADIQDSSTYEKAGYSPTNDTVLMPERSKFKSDSTYYSTLLHQLALWAGNRLGIEFGDTRRSDEYAKAELRADIATSMLCSKLGVPYELEHCTSYSERHIDILQADKREIFKASKDAENMCRYICAYHPELREQIEQEHASQMKNAVANGAPEEMFDVSEFDFDLPELELSGLHP